MGQHISHSQIGKMLSCARQYQYSYIDKLDSLWGYPFLLGQSYHAAIERNFRAKLNTGEDLAVEDCVAAFESYWNSELGSREWNWKDQKPGDIYDHGVGLVRLYLATTAPFVMPAQVEVPFNIPFPELTGRTLKGRIDLITDKGVVVDHKTSTKAKSEKMIHKEIQFSAYAAVVLADPALDVVPCAWHTAIYKSKPEIQELGTERNRADVAWYLALCEQVIRQIDSGIFPPNPTSMFCSPDNCGFWDRCKAGAR